MVYSVFDIETDGLIETVTKLHCLSYKTFDSEKGLIAMGSLTNYNEIKDFVENQEVLVGHNIIRYDIPVLNKLLNTNVKARLIDTLGISWYLYPLRDKHGLESWGDEFNVPKPKILDWNNLTVEEYIHRCETDVEINTILLNKQIDYLNELYKNVENGVNRIMGYLSFKLDCAKEQEEVKLKLDITTCKKNLDYLLQEKQKRVDILSSIMPPRTLYKIASRPKVLYKKDGTLSEHGKRWFDILKENNLPEYHVGAVKIPKGEEKGNPNSHSQVKEWLFSLGWQPDVYKYEKEEDGSLRKIPQISENGDVTNSVKALYDTVPELENLGGYYVISHRIGILEGFLDTADENGFVKAQIDGFTNTLRMQHRKPIANLPTPQKPYGKFIRECISIPDENSILCGSDMSSLEDSTKQHYMYYYDPVYVTEMRTPGFDPHIDIGVVANLITKEEEVFFKWYNKTKSENSEHKFTEEENKLFKKITNIRKKAKVVNFASVYGAGPPKIALTGGFSLQEAKDLHTIYWKRNKSVKQVAASCTVKKVNSQMWLFNPVSQFWYSLRADKDRFSTLNQGKLCSE